MMENLRVEYAEVNANFRALAEIRFKLLTFVPIISAAGIALLQLDPDSPTTLLLGILGFLVTFAIVAYDQRNSELYNDLSSRAKFLEDQLHLPPRSFPREDPRAWTATNGCGQFGERPPRQRRLFGVLLWHDLALSIVYATTLGAWTLPITTFALRLILLTLLDLEHHAGSCVISVAGWLAAVVALRIAVFFFWRIVTLDNPELREAVPSPCAPSLKLAGATEATRLPFWSRIRCRLLGA